MTFSFSFIKIFLVFSVYVVLIVKDLFLLFTLQTPVDYLPFTRWLFLQKCSIVDLRLSSKYAFRVVPLYGIGVIRILA